MRKFYLLFLILACGISCTTQSEIMNSWLGQTKQKLIMSWGPPTRTADDGAGGEILVYAKQVYVAPSSSTFYDNSGNGHTTTTEGQNYWDYKMFWVNPQGKIYHWLTKQEQVPPTQIDLRVYRK